MNWYFNALLAALKLIYPLLWKIKKNKIKLHRNILNWIGALKCIVYMTIYKVCNETKLLEYLITMICGYKVLQCVAKNITDHNELVLQRIKFSMGFLEHEDYLKPVKIKMYHRLQFMNRKMV